KWQRNLGLPSPGSACSECAYAAGAGDGRLEKIDRASYNEILDGVTSMQVLPDSDRDLALLSKKSMTRDIFHEQRFLEPKSAIFGESLGGFHRHIESITLICISHDDEVFA